MTAKHRNGDILFAQKASVDMIVAATKMEVKRQMRFSMSDLTISAEGPARTSC
jgi:hypothetical protein